MKSALNALALACLAGAASPVLADAYGSATFSNVRVTLIDLNPGDGIAPSIVFMPDPGKYASGAYIGGVAQTGQPNGNEPGNIYDSFNRTSASSQSNINGSIHNALASSSASVTGSATGAGFSAASVSGSALSTAVQSAFFTADAFIPDISAHNLIFSLSANTEVVFSVDASMSVRTTIGHTAGAASGESAGAELQLYAAGPGLNLHMEQDLEQKEVDVGWMPGDAPGGATDSWSGVLSASYSNLSNRSHEGEFGAEAHLYGISVANAVPEPSTYAMLLAGLGLVATQARRRHRSSKRAD